MMSNSPAYLIYLAAIIATSAPAEPGKDSAAGAGLQYRDGLAASGLALPSLHGRMMPHRVMREKGFP
jgi:hypothetical protein